MTIHQVDAFTAKPFTGNPAAVHVASSPKDMMPDSRMLDIAREMNLSETAFVRPLDEGEKAQSRADFSIRWFTPSVEVALCGHATLSAAHILYETKRVPEDALIRFVSKSGTLLARGRAGLVELDFPSLPVGKPSAFPPDAIAAFMGASPAEAIEFDAKRVFLVYEKAGTVRALKPDFTAMTRLGIIEALVTAPSDMPDCDFVSRVFAPGEGIDEDPVTGSAHCLFAPFWGARLGKTKMRGFQASRRSGFVGCELDGKRVRLTGEAVTVMRSRFLA